MAQLKQQDVDLREVFNASGDSGGGLHISTCGEAAAGHFSSGGSKTKKK